MLIDFARSQTYTAQRVYSGLAFVFTAVLCTEVHALQYQFLDLGTLGGTSSYAASINNSGQIVGSSAIAGNAATHPVLWNNGVASDLGTLGGNFGFATGINDSGQVAGYTHNFAGFLHATGWYGIGRVDLGMVDNPSGTGGTQLCQRHQQRRTHRWLRPDGGLLQARNPVESV